MIRDLIDRNRESIPTWPAMREHLPARLLSQEERRAIFEDDHEGWNRFYGRYPDATGLTTISRVGLGREPDRALFYLAHVRGYLAAVGGFHVLERQGDSWVELPVAVGVRWVS